MKEKEKKNIPCSQPVRCIRIAWLVSYIAGLGGEFRISDPKPHRVPLGFRLSEREFGKAKRRAVGICDRVFQIEALDRCGPLKVLVSFWKTHCAQGISLSGFS